MRALSLLAFLPISYAVLAASSADAMMEADKFVGAWRLVSAEFRNEDGSPAASPYGEQPQGVLMYDAHGTMSAQLSQSGRVAFAIPDRMRGTPEEIKAAFETYQAYWGRYAIDEREHTVTHTVMGALLPNWVGTRQRRHYSFRDGKLELRTPPLAIGGRQVTGVLLWEKIRLGQ